MQPDAVATMPSPSGESSVSFIEKIRLKVWVPLMKKLLAYSPHNPSLHARLGMAEMRLGNYQASVIRLRKSLMIFPYDFYVSFNLGLAYEYLENFDEALRAYRQAIALNPKFTDAVHRRDCLVLYLNHQKAHAANKTSPPTRKVSNDTATKNSRSTKKTKKAQKAKKISRDAEWYYSTGSKFYQSGKFNQALASFDQALALKPDYAKVYNDRGIVFAYLNRIDEALASFDKAIALDPDCAEAYNNRGNALHALKRWDEALASFDKAIVLDPDCAEAYNNRGGTLRALKRWGEALASFDRAIALDPDCAEAYNNRGGTLRALKRWDEALASFDKAIVLDPDCAEAYSNRGGTLHALKRWDEALASFDKAIALDSDCAEAYNGRGYVLFELKRWDEALANFDKAITLAPDCAEVYNNRGNALHALKRWDEALASCDKAIALDPDCASAYNNRSSALYAFKRWDEALASCDKAIALDPDLGSAYISRGMFLATLRRLDEAQASYDKALSLNPGHAPIYWNKSLAWLAAGDLEKGFELYEWRWQWDDFPSLKRNFSQPLWLGKESLDGKKILLHCEQGLGDSIQFCRYVKLVKALGAHVLMEAPEPLIALFRDLAGVDELIKFDDRLPSFDYHCPLLSLPLAFNTRLDTIPSQSSYLASDKTKVAHWQEQLGEKSDLRVGLVWSGSTFHGSDHYRSIALDTLLPHLPNDIDYICLQKELRDEDQASLQNSSIKYFGDQINDFSDTAALCELMDVIVSVDTSVAHLAAALGKPTWLMLPYATDWRWMLDRNDTPWYESMRLFRQAKDDNWDTVLRQVGNELKQLS